MPAILAKSSRRKSRYRTGLLTRCEIVSKRCLLVLNLQKRTAAKALQMRRLSTFAFEAITLWNFEKKMNEANASVKRNTKNTIKQIKPHLHGRVLAARIDILPFFFLKSRRSLTRRKIHVRFCLRDIARHAPKKIKSQHSLTRERF